jgi:predicted transcriptional regulator
MIFSKDTEQVLSFLDEVTESSLRKRNDLGVLLEIGASYDAFEEFNAVLFTGSFIWNLASKLKKINEREEGIDTLKKEFATATNELITNLHTLITLADEESKQRFDDIYFVDSLGAIQNLVDLSHDIAKLKQALNTLKQNMKKDEK